MNVQRVASTPGSASSWYRRLAIPALLPALVLASVMIYCVTRSIVSANWATGLELLPLVALPALLVGMIFGRIPHLPSWLAHLLSALLGVIWVVQCSEPVLDQALTLEFGPELTGRLVTWADRASELAVRFLIWGRTLQAGGRGEDIVLYVISIALLGWALGYGSGWILFRHGSAWWVVILNAVVILINYTFAWPKPSTLFFIFLVAALLLIAYQQVIRQQHSWDAALIDYPEFISWRFLVAAGLLCAVVVIITSLLPNQVSNVQVARVWRVVSSPLTAAREGFDNAFSTINAPPGTSGGGFTTRSVRVGGGRSLSDEPVMRVRSSLFDYWRAIAWDRYTGQGWQNTVGERARSAIGATTVEGARTPISPGMLVPIDSIRGRTLVTQTVELLQNRSDELLTYGGEFARSGLSVLVQNGFVQENGQLRPNYDETSAVVSDLPLLATTTYTVTTYRSLADESGLRTAGTDYPAWVTEQYLQLGDTVTQRTRDRAVEIITAAGATNPYDQALAIQSALRTFPYDESRPAPPLNQDWVDYFLFDGQRGYCDDFASAMVVMLRSLGVPARWVQGYAGGTMDPDTGAYLVTEKVAHSWPEVYFPGYGWQRFEPTPASYANVPVRPATAAVAENSASSSTNIDGLPPGLLRDRELYDLDQELQQSPGDMAEVLRLQEERRRAELMQQVTLAGIILALLLLGVVGFIFWLNYSLRGMSPAQAAYARLERMAGWVGIRQDEATTSYEYAARIIHELPAQREPIEQIVDAYVREAYAPASRKAAFDGRTNWPSIRQALFAYLFRRHSSDS